MGLGSCGGLSAVGAVREDLLAVCAFVGGGETDALASLVVAGGSGLAIDGGSGLVSTDVLATTCGFGARDVAMPGGMALLAGCGLLVGGWGWLAGDGLLAKGGFGNAGLSPTAGLVGLTCGLLAKGGLLASAGLVDRGAGFCGGTNFPPDNLTAPRSGLPAMSGWGPPAAPAPPSGLETMPSGSAAVVACCGGHDTILAAGGDDRLAGALPKEAPTVEGRRVGKSHQNGIHATRKSRQKIAYCVGR